MWRMLAFLAALGSALVALAAQTGRFDARLDLFSHFAPVAFAGGIGALFVWALARPRNRITAALAVIAVVASGALMAAELLAPQPRVPAGPGAVKVIQFNCWGRNESWNIAARWLLEEDADVVVLEELHRPLPTALTDRYPYVTTCADPAPCGTTILSKAPPVARRGFVDGSEPFLSAAWATYATPDGPLTIAGVHYTRPTDPELLQAQSARMARILRELPRERLIVSGDFNLTPWSHLLRRQDRAFGLERVTRALATWPGGTVSGLRIWTPFPVMPIDHVYTGPGWRTVSVERGPKVGSDHYPVVVVLTPARPSPSTAAR